MPPECGGIEGVDALADEIGVFGGELAGIEACDNAEERHLARDVFTPFVLANAPAEDVIELGSALGQLHVHDKVRLVLLVQEPIGAMAFDVFQLSLEGL